MLSLVTGAAIASDPPFWYQNALVQWHRLPFIKPDLPKGDAMGLTTLVVPMGPVNREDLYAVDSSTGGVVRKLTIGGFGAITPTFTADRRTVFFSDLQGAVHVVGSDGNGNHVLFPANEKCQSVRHLSMARDDDDHLLVQCRKRPVGGVLDVYDTFQLVDLYGAVVQEFNFGSTRVDDPTLSPDGKFLAYWGSTDLSANSPNGGALFVTTTDGANTMSRLTNPGVGTLDADPAWSPDGKEIAFRRRSAGKNDVYKVSVPGGVEKLILEKDANYEKPSWSPDGLSIVAVRYTLGVPRAKRSCQLTALEIAAGRTRLLGRQLPSIYAPAWSGH